MSTTLLKTDKLAVVRRLLHGLDKPSRVVNVPLSSLKACPQPTDKDKKAARGEQISVSKLAQGTYGRRIVYQRAWWVGGSFDLA